MINPDSVFDSVRRGYNELETSSNAHIVDYFSNIDADAMAGHVSNIKGIVFEQEVVNALNEQGLDTMMFEATNHPISDIAIMSDGDIALEMQLKATDSAYYINSTLEQYSDVPIIVTSEVAAGFDSAMIIDSGLDNAALEVTVIETLLTNATNDVTNNSVNEGLSEIIGESLLPIPISPIGLIASLFGLPFL